MKKYFMLLIAALSVVSLTGCASDVLIRMPNGQLVPGPKQSKMDPNFRDTAEFVGTFGPMAACWAKYGPLAGVACAVVGNKVTRGIVGEDYAAKGGMVARRGSYGRDYYGPRGSYSGAARQVCYDQGSGGYADCDEYYRRYNGISYSGQPQMGRRVVYPQSQPQVVYQQPPILQAPVVAAPQAVPVVVAPTSEDLGRGRTVDNYMQAGMVEPKCQVADRHEAGKCLLQASNELYGEQRKCDTAKASGTPLSPICSKPLDDFARIYARLAGKLLE